MKNSLMKKHYCLAVSHQARLGGCKILNPPVVFKMHASRKITFWRLIEIQSTKFLMCMLFSVTLKNC